MGENVIQNVALTDRITRLEEEAKVERQMRVQECERLWRGIEGIHRNIGELKEALSDRFMEVDDKVEAAMDKECATTSVLGNVQDRVIAIDDLTMALETRVVDLEESARGRSRSSVRHARRHSLQDEVETGDIATKDRLVDEETSIESESTGGTYEECDWGGESEVMASSSMATSFVSVPRKTGSGATPREPSRDSSRFETSQSTDQARTHLISIRRSSTPTSPDSAVDVISCPATPEATEAGLATQIDATKEMAPLNQMQSRGAFGIPPFTAMHIPASGHLASLNAMPLQKPRFSPQTDRLGESCLSQRKRKRGDHHVEDSSVLKG